MDRFFRSLAAVLLGICVLLLLLWLPLRADMLFTLEDTQISLDTSRQREVKQTYEYNQVVGALPLAREELAELEPQVEAAVELDQQRRSERKQLRAEIKALKEQLEAITGEAP